MLDRTIREYNGFIAISTEPECTRLVTNRRGVVALKGATLVAPFNRSGTVSSLMQG